MPRHLNQPLHIPSFNKTAALPIAVPHKPIKNTRIQLLKIGRIRIGKDKLPRLHQLIKENKYGMNKTDLKILILGVVVVTHFSQNMFTKSTVKEVIVTLGNGGMEKEFRTFSISQMIMLKNCKGKSRSRGGWSQFLYARCGGCTK